MSDPSDFEFGKEPDDTPPNSEQLARIVDSRLHVSHLADLRASGLSDRTIAVHEFRTLTDSAAIAKKLNWSGATGAAKLGPCLEIPFFGVEDNRTDFSRLKPLTPREETCRAAKSTSAVVLPVPVGLRSSVTPDRRLAIRFRAILIAWRYFLSDRTTCRPTARLIWSRTAHIPRSTIKSSAPHLRHRAGELKVSIPATAGAARQSDERQIRRAAWRACWRQA